MLRRTLSIQEKFVDNPTFSAWKSGFRGWGCLKRRLVALREGGSVGRIDRGAASFCCVPRRKPSESRLNDECIGGGIRKRIDTRFSELAARRAGPAVRGFCAAGVFSKRAGRQWAVWMSRRAGR